MPCHHHIPKPALRHSGAGDYDEHSRCVTYLHLVPSQVVANFALV